MIQAVLSYGLMAAYIANQPLKITQTSLILFPPFLWQCIKSIPERGKAKFVCMVHFMPISIC